MKKQLIKRGFIILCCFIFISCLSGIRAYATEKQTVKVAFFPMDGYHIKNTDGSLSGMDVEYLSAISQYTNWKLEYVMCESWEDALNKLEQHQVDLVGSAQYSQSRAEVFDYADLSSGYTFGIIATNSDGDIAYEDFEAMKDITFGMVKGYVRKAEFLQYLAENQITQPIIKEYENTHALQDALDTGKIDALVHTFMEVEEGQRLIGRFAPRPIYYITYKGNSKILMELNSAIADLKINAPELETNLMNQYYYHKLDKRVLFTTDEKQYLQNKQTLVVGYFDDYYPFSYKDVTDGTFKGLSKSALENGLLSTGLHITYKKLDNHQTAQAALESGEIDLLLYCIETDMMNNNNQLMVLKEYAQIPLVLVTRKDQSYNDIKTLTTIDALSKQVDSIIETNNLSLIIQEEQQDCFELLENNMADAILCDGYLAKYLMRMNPQYSNLKITSVVHTDHTVHMVINQKNASALNGIISKTISTITEKDVNEYELKENLYPLISISAFVKDNSLIIVAILLILIAVIIMIAIHFVTDSRRIQHLMYKDTTMDIWNMNYLVFMGEQKLVSEQQDQYAIVCLNILRLHRYNVIHGWEAGQKLLELAKTTLQKCVDEKREICARNYGDRFVLFLAWNDWDAFMKRLENIQEIVNAVIYNHTEIHMMMQMGVYAVPTENPDLLTAVTCANQALDILVNSKSHRNEIKVYDAPFESMIKERHQREKLLESVTIEDNFVTYYQSKVDIRTDAIIGAEALVRFLDPTANGAVRSPGYFVGYYEETGRIVDIDFFVMESTCKMLRKRLDEGKPVVPVSCNFSRLHFTKPGFPERFEAILNKYQISKDLIEVEITETLVMEEAQQQLIKDTLQTLKSNGIRLSIDDFGSGYSSLGVFEQIPAAVIKLDRSFLLNRKDHSRKVKIMHSIVKLTEELGAQIVCEGVETKEDVALMNEIQAYVAQGYFYSKPVPQQIFEEKLDQLA